MANLQELRIGKISSINYKKGTARVTYEYRDDTTTVELPFLSWEYQMPEVGDMVVTAHLWGGATAAVILGPLWHDGHRPVSGKKGLYRKEYERTQGAAYEEYNDTSKSFKVVAGGVTLTMQDGILTVGGSMKVTGDLSVSGDLTVSGTIHN